MILALSRRVERYPPSFPSSECGKDSLMKQQWVVRIYVSIFTNVDYLTYVFNETRFCWLLLATQRCPTRQLFGSTRENPLDDFCVGWTLQCSELWSGCPSWSPCRLQILRHGAEWDTEGFLKPTNQAAICPSWCIIFIKFIFYHILVNQSQPGYNST